MTHVITTLCLCYGACVEVCPAECIIKGTDGDKWSQFYIDPNACIDCFKCTDECPFLAIFPGEEVPTDYIATGGEYINLHTQTQVAEEGDIRIYIGIDIDGNDVILTNTRRLAPGEVVDFTADVELNRRYFDEGPGYG